MAVGSPTNRSFDRLSILAFEAVSSTRAGKNCSLLHAACINRDVNTVKVIFSCSPSAIDTAIAMKMRVRGNGDLCYCGLTTTDLAESATCLRGILNAAHKRTQDIASLMHESARKGNVRQIKRVLELGEDVNQPSPLRDDQEATPILLAAASNSCKVVRFLCGKGANRDVRDRARRCILHHAAIGGNIETVEYLLRSGVPVDSKSTWAKTALHEAAQKGYAKIVKILIEHGANIESSTALCDTPLLLASEEGHLACVDELIKNGASINTSNNYLKTALHNSAGGGHTDIVRRLLRRGCKVGCSTAKGETPLSLAVRRKGNSEVVSLLLDGGSDANLCDQYGRTPLHFSADENIAQLLVQHGASPQSRDFEGKTPLFFAALDGHQDIVEFFLQRGSLVNVLSHSGEAPLHEAAIRGHAHIAKVLLQHGASINPVRVTGETPLFLSAIACRTEVVKLLLDSGADVNIASQDMGTPLDAVTAVGGSREIVDLLVRFQNSKVGQ